MERKNNGRFTEIISTLKERAFKDNPKRSLRCRVLRWSAIMFVGLVVFPVCLVATLAYALYHIDEQTGMVSKAFDLPDFNQKVNTPLAYTSTLTDRDGAPLSCYTKEHRVTVDIKVLKEKNPQLIKAIIASEDSRFLPDENWYWRSINYFTGPIVRPGYDLKGIFHAAVTDIAAGHIVAGGSTVEQQIIKNKMLSSKRAWSRKFAEVFLAVKLKQHLSPDEILQMYVDLVFIGGPYGVGAAAPAYFGKPAEAISLDQSAILAGMINNSEALVTIHSENKEERMRALQKIKERRDRVLRLMLEHDFINFDEYGVAVAAPITPLRFTGACEKKEQFVSEMVRTTYEEKFGNLHTGGYRFVSTLDSGIQRSAKDACESALKQYLVRHPENRSTMQCNTLVVDIPSGEVLALIGGQDFSIRQVNGVTYDKDLPGSSFKPFLYATFYEFRWAKEMERRDALRAEALLEGRESPVFEVYDPLAGCTVRDFANVLVPAVIGSTRDRVVVRKLIRNYPEEHRASYLGVIPCAVALAGSENSGTVWAESQMSPVGASEARRWREGGDLVINMSHRLGIKSKLQNFATVPLGFNDVSLWELAEAYLPFYNGGCRQELHIVHSITNLKGEQIFDGSAKKDCVRVLSPEVARAMRASLQAVVDHEYGTAHSLRKLFPKGDLAGKTGTATRGDGSSVVTNLYVGATPKYLIATRLATIDRQPLGRKETGAKNALPVFRDIIVNSHLFEAGELFTAIPDLSKGVVFTPPKYDYEGAHPEITAQLEKMRLIDERRKVKKNPKSVLRLDGPASVTMHLPKTKNPSSIEPSKLFSLREGLFLDQIPLARYNPPMTDENPNAVRITEIEALMLAPDFWSNKDRAQALIKELADCKVALEGGGKYDKANAIITVFSGAGGDDSEDFSAMLVRMYFKYCERRGWGYEVLHENENDHGGYRNITFEVNGKASYGELKNESGVHRLVRISPFNAAQKRHTSFSMVEVIPKFKKGEIEAIPESEVRFEYSRSGGAGGQNVNKRETAVRVIHEPTGLAVHVSAERSQLQNRERALEILAAKIFHLRESLSIEEKEKMYVSKTTKVEWGNQIRSYVLHPYKMVKDHRTDVETSKVDAVLERGELDEFIEAEKNL